MKSKVSLSLMLVIILTSSCMNKEKKAEKLIKEDLFESLFDFSSYEPIRTEKIDSAFSSPETDSIIYLNAITLKYAYDEMSKLNEEVEDALFEMRLWVDSHSYYGRSKYLKANEHAEELLNKYKFYDSIVVNQGIIIKNLIAEFKPEFIGFKTIHKFRAKNKAGNYGISSIEYVFDKKMKKIISQEIILGDNDDELTVKDIVEELKGE
ncbi:MAG: hypothetical protein WBH98_01195 [Bacteroidales bacterium]